MIDELDRFCSKIIVVNNCFIWDGAKGRFGYGYFKVKGKMVSAHRYSYLRFKGKIPKGKQLDHLCRHTSCVNPEHLEVVTPRENTMRSNVGLAKRLLTHCIRNHEFTFRNTYVRKDGMRKCKSCDNMRHRN